MNLNIKIAARLSQITGFLVLLVTLISLFSGEFYYLFIDETRVATYQGQDILALLTIPFLYLVIHLSKRKSIPAFIIWISINGFYLYIYSIYAFNGIYSELFLFYIAIISLSFYTFIRLLGPLDVHALSNHFSKNAPRKIVSLYLILIATLQAIAWIAIILQHINYSDPAPANAIFVLDLAILLPLFVLSAFWLWRSHTKGFLAAPSLLVFNSIYGLAFITGEFLKYYRNLEYSSLSIYIFIIFTFIAIVLSIIFLTSSKNTFKKPGKKKKK